MKFFFLLSCLFFAVTCLAQTTPAPKKSQFSTEVYEKEDHQSKFTDVVKVIREMDGGTEVVFAKFGTYTAPSDGTAMERLQESQKSKLPVPIVFNEDSRKILKVGAPQKPPEKAGAAGSGPNK